MPSPARELTVGLHELLHVGNLRGEDETIRTEAKRFGRACAFKRAFDKRFKKHLAGRARQSRRPILIHKASEQRLVERSAVHADAHRGARALGDLDHRGEVFFGLRPFADIAGIDPVL